MLARYVYFEHLCPKIAFILIILVGNRVPFPTYLLNQLLVYFIWMSKISWFVQILSLHFYGNILPRDILVMYWVLWSLYGHMAYEQYITW